MEMELAEQYYKFAVAELPRVKDALATLQTTKLGWLDEMLESFITSTIQGFEDTIRDFESRLN